MTDSDESGDQGATPARRKRIWRRIRRTAYWVTGIGIVVPVLAFLVGYLIWDVRDPHQVLAGLEKTVVLEYADGSELLKLTPEDGDRRFVPYQEVPRRLREAIIAVEDPTFWENEGFDPAGIARAAITGVGGGSGITQQYIKKSTGEDQATYLRKFKELVLATKITQEQRKEEIFESYVNIISFGRNTHGPAAAIEAYFGKSIEDGLSWSQAAFLAGMIQSPSVHDPAVSGHAHAKKRWEYVMAKLVERGYLEPSERARISYPGDEIADPAESRAGQLSYTEYHIKQRVLAELEREGVPMDRLRREGMRIETTIDPGAQAESERVVRERLAGQPDHLRAALVAVAPETGAVVAYHGGSWNVRDYAATPRPPGSAFHPFVTVAGLRQGSGIEKTFPAPHRMHFGGEEFRNATDCASTERCSVREATRVSADTPFVAMTKAFGAENVSEAARDAGIPAEIAGEPTLREPDGVSIGPGIAVGRYPVRPLDLAGAYATFAGQGMRVRPHFVARVRDEDGEVAWQRRPSGVPAFGTGPESSGRDARIAAEVTASLREVGERSADLPGGRPAAAKAGTHRFAGTGDNSAAWMAGYTPQLATAVWVGADRERRLRDARNERVTGETIPADIWRSFMADYHRDLPVSRLPPAPPPRVSR
ncbi:transglycosylase domain-containing protein [Amycolatopsis aidingensis]|uniref:transglycosylase domain-containing protein n=1 Tax=Amycolatopsis aidingensis TaxID=2842453 RepID=UPI001C0C755E|nr:transglycosylase domain-containing protein [Amycolatopsis aidingensis]